jgi:HTH-type transcriptional repressor of NAD biosynthesis genes
MKIFVLCIMKITKIVFVGPESTGKTTLCKNLAMRYSTNWVCEVCRIFAEDKKQHTDDIQFNFNLQDFIEMANQQNKKEYELSQTANKLLFCDNDSFALSIWCERYLDQYHEEIYDIYKNALYLDNDKKIYILTKPNVPFVQDGFRDGEHIRDWMYERFLKELQNKGMTYYILESSDYDERLLSVINIINKIE